MNKLSFSGWMSLLGVLVLVACSAEEPSEATQQGSNEGILTFPDVLEVEAPVGESSEATFILVNFNSEPKRYQVSSFAAASWLDFTSENTGGVIEPGEAVPITVQPRCDEEQLELRRGDRDPGPKNELLTTITIGSADVDAPDVEPLPFIPNTPVVDSVLLTIRCF